MIKTALWPLQQAVYTKLNTDTDLMSMVNGVYDEVEDGVKLPYVSIGDDTANPYDTKTSNGEDITLTLHCYANGPGKTNAKQIMDAVLQAMTATPLTVAGFKVDGIKREFLEVMQDGQVYHGICRFRIYITE